MAKTLNQEFQERRAKQLLKESTTQSLRESIAHGLDEAKGLLGKSISTKLIEKRIKEIDFILDMIYEELKARGEE